MSGLVQRVRANVDNRCITARIRKQGCRVSLDGAPAPRLIIDFDKPGSPVGSSTQRCDYLLVAKDANGEGWVAPMELKSGRFDTSQVVGQLRAGAQAADQLVPQNEKVRFRPVAVFGRTLHKAEHFWLKQKRNRVRFRGSHPTVQLMRCGGILADQLR